ncbi:LacI family DNA-binding transcriptional regulator [Sinorhizobium medicae]|uniref:LacI family DNA-binding transcriptional regulator n=3 Tax=Sinorhizobium medicae TaxID=110321 RepID=A0A6G1WLR2_9HYPH|nr:regulatory protein LacI [Sinorhizobium medicae WSM419]MDX0412344.1 LacI family DNA-binding transcriptional regulator [Sinorhizobium medicae]MDX0424888.1 LacI family DNA-binding transcriptional regulator [Sinorhizobium medicae]MDX0431985.1 LacI family DNA-binding transcriptional regulator [Sinorhizobium medicae]MDX0437334.1 LacI family DNA-binding transcriptional regulator [Sinorhizobium medicae]
MMARSTIVELARAAGVSPTTVSHAFSGRRYVDPETKARIVALADKMGYRANPRARRLRTGGAGIIALASSMPFAIAAGPARLGFLMEIAAAAAVTALSRHLALCLVPPLEPDSNLDALEVDGAIIVEPTSDDRLLEFFSARGVPVVSIGRAPGRDDIPSVDIQSTATARLMLEHLGANNRRVGLITGEQRRNSYIETEAVYAAFAAENGYTPVALRVNESGGEGEAAAIAETLLRGNPDIDALCVPVDAFATGVLTAARSLNRSVPLGLRLATRYDGMRAKLSVPQMTAVNLHLDQVAEAAIDLLIAVMEGKDPERRPIAPPLLVVRESSAT